MDNNGNGRQPSYMHGNHPGAHKLQQTSLGHRPAPLVSVVIPAYRCAEYIGQAIQSVLAQSFSDYETIVVNDGSPDTPLLEAALQKYWDRITYIRQRTRGPSGARNTGILQARGKYLAFLDADDYWGSDHLSTQLELLQENGNLDLVYCDFFLVNAECEVGRAFDIEPQSPPVTFDSLLVDRCTIGTSTTVMSREAIVQAGMFDEAFSRCEDFEMWLRMAFSGCRMAFHPQPQVFHRINHGGLSADRWAMRQDRIRVYEKLTSTLPISKEQRQVIRDLARKAEADCHIDEVKQAVEQGDYEAARKSVRRARELRDQWKLRLSAFGLRLAPKLFRRLHLLRSKHLLADKGLAPEVRGPGRLDAVTLQQNRPTAPVEPIEARRSR